MNKNTLFILGGLIVVALAVGVGMRFFLASPSADISQTTEVTPSPVQPSTESQSTQTPVSDIVTVPPAPEETVVPPPPPSLPAAPKAPTKTTSSNVIETIFSGYKEVWKEANGDLTYWLGGAALGPYLGSKISADVKYCCGIMVNAIVLKTKIDVGHVLATTDIRRVTDGGALLPPDSPPPYLLKQGGTSGPWNFTITDAEIVFIVPITETDFTFRVPDTNGGYKFFRVFLNNGILNVGEALG